MGLVLTKKVLGILFFEFLAGLLFVVPIIWSNTAMSRRTAEGDAATGDCGLGAEDRALMVETCSMLCQAHHVHNFNSACMYNWTVGPVG